MNVYFKVNYLVISNLNNKVYFVLIDISRTRSEFSLIQMSS